MFKGITTPVMMALGEDKKINNRSMASVIDFLINGKVDGLLFFGSCGEFFAFTQQEKMAFIKFACKYVAGRTRIFIGVGSTNINEVIELAKYAETCQATGVVIISPYYFSFDEEGVFRFYEEILESIGLPVLAYNFPDRTGFSLTPTLLKRLALKYPHFVGVKDTVDTISHTREIINEVKSVRPDFCVYSGYDEYYLPNLLAGGDGAIAGLSNLFPEVYRSLYDDYVSGNYRSALDKAKFISKAMSLYTCGDSYISALKYAMHLKGLPINDISTSPIPPLNDEDKEKIKILLNQLTY